MEGAHADVQLGRALVYGRRFVEELSEEVLRVLGDAAELLDQSREGVHHHAFQLVLYGLVQLRAADVDGLYRPLHQRHIGCCAAFSLEENLAKNLCLDLLVYRTPQLWYVLLVHVVYAYYLL